MYTYRTYIEDRLIYVHIEDRLIYVHIEKITFHLT